MELLLISKTYLQGENKVNSPTRLSHRIMNRYLLEGPILKRIILFCN